MKQAFPALKLPIFVLLLFVATVPLSAQVCYENFMVKGKQAFEAFQFEKAIKNFEAAKVCPDRPDDSAAEEWIAKAQNGYIDRLQLIASKYLTSEAQSAFNDKEYRIAFRLCQEALKYKNDNKDAIALQKEMLPYMADYQYDIEVDPRFYDPSQVALPRDSFLVLFDKNVESKKLQIKLVAPKLQTIKQSFELAGSPSNYQFSNDAKWLAVEYFNRQKQQINLTLWEVSSGQVMQTFEKIHRSDAYKGFAFSENGEKLVFRTEKIIKRISFRTVDEDEVKPDTLRELGYSLNVYDLSSKKIVFTTGAITDYFTASPDSEGSIFRGEPIRQDLINEKIAVKFSTEGVITTNNQNFVLKENEFRIRENHDFEISPDGKKFAYHEYSEEQQTEINFDAEVKITIGPRPMTLIGNIKVYNLENDRLILSVKSDYEALPQRFLPFTFSKNSGHFIYIDSRKWTGTNFNDESLSVDFRTSFNIYDLEKKQYLVENADKFFDYFVTKNNKVVIWAGSDYFINKVGQFNVYDLKLDSMIFGTNILNDFSHFYDVNTADDLLYFSTFNPNTLKTSINVIDTKLDTLKTLKLDFVPFEYTYLRMSADLKKSAFLTAQGRSIKVWDLVSEKPIREIKCQSQIAEFDFSNDINSLIVRDKNGFLKVVDLTVTEDLFDYFNKHLEQLTDKEKEEIGIDW